MPNVAILPEGKIYHAEYSAKYNKTSEQIAYHAEYAKTPEAKAAQAEYVKANPGVVNAKTARRRSAKLHRTPFWLTKEQKKQIKEFYIVAALISGLCPEPMEVDHIVPLQGKNVSGLHVPWNLQILSESDNRKKKNKLVF